MLLMTAGETLLEIIVSMNNAHAQLKRTMNVIWTIYMVKETRGTNKIRGKEEGENSV